MKIHKWSATVLLALFACLMIGCKSMNPATGQYEFDPLKTDAVKAALELPVKSAIRRAILNSPDHADEIADYFRQVATVFCKMSTTGTFDPLFLIAEVDKLVIPKIPDPLILDAKDSLITLYRIFYSQRFTAELSPQEWPFHLADFFCTAINTALKDAGKPGVADSMLHQSMAARMKAVQKIAAR